MKIEKTECNYQVTQCDLKFGKQITLDGELLIPISVIDKIRAEIEREIIPRNSDQYDYEAKWQNSGLRMALKVIDRYKAESEERNGSQN